LVDFRYHLVTIIAIFLALAVGVVVGTTALNGPVLDGLRDRNSGLISDKRALQGDVRDLEDDVLTADQFARAVYGQVLGGTLAGERVLVVTAPEADGSVADQLTPALTAAGASVTGRLALQPALFAPAQTQLVEDLVASVVPAGVELPETSAVERAAAVFAAALLVQPGEDALEADDALQVVSAFEEAGLVDLTDEGEQLQPATGAVLLAAPVPEELPEDPAVDRDGRLEGLLALAEQLDARSGGLVVAGPPEALRDGGLVRALRADDARSDEISSVDNADRGIGQAGVVLALAEQLDGGAGDYGSGSGVMGPLPGAGSGTDDDADDADDSDAPPAPPTGG
jgi:hypothetical protein